MTRVRVALAIVTALAIPQLAAAQYKGQHTGLPLIDHPWAHPGQYVENISEEGFGAIGSTAALLADPSELRVSRSPLGGITETFTSNACFFPTTEGKQDLKNQVCRQAIEARREAWMKFLRVQADVDGSGFVTTEEAAAIHREVRTAFHVSQLGIDNLEGLMELPDCRAQGEATVLARLAAYAKLREQAVKEKLQGMPELPAPLSQAVRVAASNGSPS